MAATYANQHWRERVTQAVGKSPLHWDQLTWPQLQRLRDQGPGLVLLPIGATEQHGPHLPTGTDTLIASAVCAYASAITQTPILPTLPISVSVGHTPRWTGTVSFKHNTFIHAVYETVQWLVATGWTRVLLVNSHFGNDASLRVTVDQLRTDYLGQLQIGCLHTFNLSPGIWDWFVEDADDLHANRAETDLLLYLAPEQVDLDALPEAGDPDRTEGVVFSYPVAQTSTNGVTGQPLGTSAQRGEELFHLMGDALAQKIEQAKTEQPPLPPTDPLPVSPFA